MVKILTAKIITNIHYSNKMAIFLCLCLSLGDFRGNDNHNNCKMVIFLDNENNLTFDLKELLEEKGICLKVLSF